MPDSLQLPAGGLLIVIGLVACFAGYRLFRAVLTVYGFLVGAVFASTLVPHGDAITVLVAMLVGGALGAALLFAVYFAGVVIVGAGAGVVVAQAVWQAWRGADAGLTVMVFGAAIGAALAAAWQRYVVILSTAFVGARTAVAGFLAFLAGSAPSPPALHPTLIAQPLGTPSVSRQSAFLAWLVLGAIGTIVQLSSTSPRPRDKR